MNGRIVSHIFSESQWETSHFFWYNLRRWPFTGEKWGRERDMKEGFKDKVAKFCTIALLVVIGAGGAVSVWPTYLRGRSLKLQDAELTRRIEEKKREIEKRAVIIMIIVYVVTYMYSLITGSIDAIGSAFDTTKKTP